MHPSKFGDTYDIAKLSMLPWLALDEGWFYHPMYFPGRGEVYDGVFPGQYADFLGVRLVGGNIGNRRALVNSVAGNPGYLFLDPDTGLRLTNVRSRKHVTLNEFIEIAHGPARELVLVFDQSIDRNGGTRREQIKRKLCCLHEAQPRVHGAAYVSHIAFIWVSTDPRTVSEATCRFLQASGLPQCCLVDDGCGHILCP